MSPRRRPSPDEDDLVDAPLLEDAERAEAAWLLARDKDPDAAPPSAEIARRYAEIEDLLANLSPHVAHQDWQDEVSRVATAAAPPALPWWNHPAFRWACGGGLVAAAALLLVLYPRPRDELEVAIRTGHKTGDDDRPRGDAKAFVGDHLVITARPKASGDLRVYRADGKLVGRCPDGPGCRSHPGDDYTIDVMLDAPLQYRVFLVIGMANASATGTMDVYLDAARAAHARVVSPPPIDVE